MDASGMASGVPAECDFPLERRIGARAANLLAKGLDLHTVGDLLNHYPRRYMERGALTPIHELPFNENVTLVARVERVQSRQMMKRRGKLVDVWISDDSGLGHGGLKVTFFNGYKAEKELVPGLRVLFSGKVTAYRGELSLTNPLFEPLPEFDDAERADRPIPIYPATAAIPSWKIQACVATVLDGTDFSQVPDPIPEHIVDRDGLRSIGDRYRAIHQPATMGAAHRARNRFRYQEAFILQTALARRRAAVAGKRAQARPHVIGGLLDRFDADLPFTLTRGQQEVGATIADELGARSPMNRLLQGEVGSGKTLVALRAMLQVIDTGGQAALLAPTEVLAAQHWQSITAILGPLAEAGMLGGSDVGTRVALVTGSQSTARRREALLEAASGAAGIVVGTHALLSENVAFADLGLVVVDEQHRFGVEQRDVLRRKADKPPHLLVMTATPIPRTVAMTVFGDLDTSILDELPGGREPIQTHLAPLADHPSWERRVWERSREEIDAGRQVFVVCPKIGDAAGSGTDDDDGTAWVPDIAGADGRPGANDPAGTGGTVTDGTAGAPLSTVVDVEKKLRAEPVLAGVRIGVLHGRLDPEEKARTMAAFNAGELDLLISTTVIEVGVDVPNASLMVILDADRFGISQLHQLRGRVGRGSVPGTCLLVTSVPHDHPSRPRLDAVAATTDGFALSHEDLALRREGDILGAAQSGGRSTLRLLRVLHDGDIIARARDDARAIVAHDPALADFPDLRTAIGDWLDPETEAFLERG